ncbi:MAG: class I SAM-dependent methyltransferase, partial [Alphaproteobacteria bacterium]
MHEFNLLGSYPRSRRDIAARHAAQADSRATARKFGREYFDGTREQGYGGYRYDGRWVPVARDIVLHWG